MPDGRVVAVNGRFTGQAVTGVQRYALESTAALSHLIGAERVIVLTPPTDDPARSRLWEWRHLSQAADDATGSPATLNLCNWGPLRGLDSATVVVHDVAVQAEPAGFSRAYRVMSRAWTAALRHSTARVVTVSRRSQVALESLLGRGVALAPCGVTAPAEAPSSGAGGPRPVGAGRAEPPYALFVGAHDHRKNLPFALRLIPALQARGIRLVVTHRQGTRSLRETVVGVDVPGVQVVSDPSDEELWDLYRNAAVLLHPSRYEGFGLPLLEAAVRGTPFLSSPVGAAEEIAVDPRQVRDLDVDSWVSGVDELLRARDVLSPQLVARARQFSWQRTAEALLTAMHP